MKCLPRINWTYWACLMLASVFGANAGDFLADALNLGHLSGIPYLAAALAAVFLTERFSSRPSVVYFWIAIIIIRASGTNIGDIFHDYRIGFAYSLPLSAALLAASVAVWKYRKPPLAGQGIVPVNTYYWISMFFVCVLGTVGGDGMSYGTGLGNLGATLVLAVPLAMTFFIGRHGLLTRLSYYWFTVSLIRCVGTAAGDFLAHKVFGLEWATAVSGTIFFAYVLALYSKSTDNLRLREQALLPEENVS